ncbi:MAG: thiamine phosphate synthase [Candidatus Angelobacter sp.]
MPAQLYYITDRRQFPGGPVEQERRLLLKVAECAAAGVDYIQLREKDLGGRALEELAHKAMAALGSSRTRLLINSRTDVALAAGTDGVHLPAHDLPASEVRAIFARAGFSRAHVGALVISASAHSEEDIAYAESHGANLAIFAPVFEKSGTANPSGPELLRQVCRRTHAAASPIPIFALGGITPENADQCRQAGVAGIAGIRLFQQNGVQEIVRQLRGK